MNTSGLIQFTIYTTLQMIKVHNFSVEKDFRDHLLQLSLRLVVKTIGSTILTHTPTSKSLLHARSHILTTPQGHP